MGEVFKPAAPQERRNMPDAKFLVAGSLAAAILTAFAPDAEAQTDTRTIRHTTSETAFRRATADAREHISTATSIENLRLPSNVGPTQVSVHRHQAQQSGFAETGEAPAGFSARSLTGRQGTTSPGLADTFQQSADGIYLVDFRNTVQTTNTGTPEEERLLNGTTQSTVYDRLDIHPVTHPLNAAEPVPTTAPRHVQFSGQGQSVDEALAVALVSGMHTTSAELLRPSRDSAQVQLRRENQAPVYLDVHSEYTAGYLLHSQVRVTHLPSGGYTVQVEGDVQMSTQFTHVDRNGTETYETIQTVPQPPVQPTTPPRTVTEGTNGIHVF